MVVVVAIEVLAVIVAVVMDPSRLLIQKTFPPTKKAKPH